MAGYYNISRDHFYTEAPYHRKDVDILSQLSVAYAPLPK
jgi:hypothetical protein